MISENDTMMFCEEGKCVDVRTVKCDIAFENINNQIECEEMKKIIEG